MKSFTFRKQVLVLRILLTMLPVFLTPFTQIEAASLRASPCTVTWDQCQSGAVCGYAVYYSVKGSTTTNRLNVGMTNLVTFKILTASSNYLLSVVAYNVCGVESPRSSVITYTPQVFSSLRLGKPANGTMTLRFQVATGAVCHVEFTPILNPAQWQTLGSATADADGNVAITDSLSGNPTTRFYRTALP